MDRVVSASIPFFHQSVLIRLGEHPPPVVSQFHWGDSTEPTHGRRPVSGRVPPATGQWWAAKRQVEMMPNGRNSPPSTPERGTLPMWPLKPDSCSKPLPTHCLISSRDWAASAYRPREWPLSPLHSTKLAWPGQPLIISRQPSVHDALQSGF